MIIEFSEPYQTSKMELLTNIIRDFQSLFIFQKIPSYMFDRVLNTPSVLLGNVSEYIDTHDWGLSRYI